jgi:hypothetical protein
VDDARARLEANPALRAMQRPIGGLSSRSWRHCDGCPERGDG